MQFDKEIPYGKMSITDIKFYNLSKIGHSYLQMHLKILHFYKLIQSFFKDKYEQKSTQFNKVQYTVYNFLTNKY